MRRLLFTAILLICAVPADALDFHSVNGPVAILYDAPSTEAKPLFVVNRAYPLEVVVSLAGWAKVRDRSGAMAWIEQSQLNPRHTIVVQVSGDILTLPQDTAPVRGHVAAGVILTWLANINGRWAKVQLPDQSIGYLKLAQVWGA